MAFQLRHKEWGVYQGSFLGLGFWHPWSDQPEQGFCEFPTQKEADDYKAFLCSPECEMPLNADDLTVEPFDKAESDRLVAEGTEKMRADELKRAMAKPMVH